MSPDFPLPDPDARALSDELGNLIRAEIDAAGGFIPFERYMQRVMYTPGLGYYSAGAVKLGPAGDFVTAPELGGGFARVLGRQCLRLLEGPRVPACIVEFGAGSGRLAEDVLGALDAAGVSAEYRIVEISADLGERQRERLARFGTRVQWITEWPCAELDGIVIANEVLDAFPFDCFVKRERAVRALGVGHREGRFEWVEKPADDVLADAVSGIERSLGHSLPDGFRGEVCLGLAAWFVSLAASLKRGYVLLVDYGLVRRDYYHASRSAGNLVCHFRHRAHGDPFLWPGLQDISAWVDFSACAEAASAAGFDVAGFTTQAQFLLHGGIDFRSEQEPRLAALQARELATLLLPGEMGERFKVLLLQRGLNLGGTLPGRDFRERL
jgi:SAM-dependent MidA family methyltransferase